MIDKQKSLTILKSVQDAGIPIGATYLSKELSIPPASIGRILTELEDEKLIEKVSNKGRVLTDKGRQFLTHAATVKAKEENATGLVKLIVSADKTTLMEILQIRKLLEGYTIQLACKNATEEEINRLERLMLEHLHLIRNGELGNQIDLEIHLAIADISRNKTLSQLLKIMLTGDNVYTKFSYVSDSIKHTQIKQHDTIIQAIREHDPDKGKIAMETHLDQVMNDLAKYFHEDGTAKVPGD